VVRERVPVALFHIVPDPSCIGETVTRDPERFAGGYCEPFSGGFECGVGGIAVWMVCVGFGEV
jgi:hypothetical protein